jgi:hypothetical protein
LKLLHHVQAVEDAAQAGGVVIGGKPVERLIIPDSVLNNTQKKS